MDFLETIFRQLDEHLKPSGRAQIVTAAPGDDQLPTALLALAERHLSGSTQVRIDPLAHSALPDAEAQVIRSLMERLDQLEGELARTQSCLQLLAAGQPIEETCRGEAQNLKDREILAFLGEEEGVSP